MVAQPGGNLIAPKPASSVLGYLGEAGFYYEITPAVGLTFMAGAQFFTGTSTAGPVIDGTVGLRFNFFKAGPPTNSNDQYKGWRYPYGRELRYP
jgi:subtilisin family serine protease